MKCPVCGGAELVTTCRDIAQQVGGAYVTVPNETVQYCKACNAIVRNEAGDDRQAAAQRLGALGGASSSMEEIPRRRPN